MVTQLPSLPVVGKLINGLIAYLKTQTGSYAKTTSRVYETISRKLCSTS